MKRSTSLLIGSCIMLSLGIICLIGSMRILGIDIKIEALVMGVLSYVFFSHYAGMSIHGALINDKEQGL